MVGSTQAYFLHVKHTTFHTKSYFDPSAAIWNVKQYYMIDDGGHVGIWRPYWNDPNINYITSTRSETYFREKNDH